jgi:hypothetical protein
MDPSGAVVPAATVAVKHTATQTERTLASNETGIFVAQFLQPGRLRDYGDEGGLRKDGADLYSMDSVQEFQVASSN